MKKYRRKILTAAAALGLACGALFATGNTSAHADTQHELYLAHATGWCVTNTGLSPYDKFVLGACADASTQQFFLHVVSGNVFEIEYDYGGQSSDPLCVTYPYNNGAPDGGWMVDGQCAGAQTQEFQFHQVGGGWQYVMPFRTDKEGSYVTLDDANYQLVPYNKIDGSYEGGTIIGQEQWSELFTTP
jgi:hypothetical protein